MKNPLCQYRHVFGKEREGAHAYRLFGIAIVDMALTMLAALWIAYKMKVRFWVVFAVSMGCAVVAHRAFCVNTAVNKVIFGVV